MRSSSRIGLGVALSLATFVAGCNEPPNPAVEQRELPPWPSFMRKVDNPHARIGEDWRVIAERRWMKIEEQNKRMEMGERWYEESVRQPFRAK